MQQKPFEDRHDMIAFSSLVALVLGPGLASLWFNMHVAMRVLGLDPASHPNVWEALLLLMAGVVGTGMGFLLGGILWVSLMSRVLPPKTFRKWALGNTKGRMRAYAETLVQRFASSSY
jgi:hypothetical protein